MRHRNVKDAYQRLELHPIVIQDPIEYKGSWNKRFNNENPIYIEIGMGKGQFIIEHAIRNPNINFIGFEKFSAVLAKALEKVDQHQGLNNLLVIREDADRITKFFEEGELDRLYLNFSDPWPKERHEKRRLTYISFLEKYSFILKKESSIIFKTDNSKLFEFSVAQMKKFGYDVKEVIYDLQSSHYAQDNIMTEYETKFVSQGLKIYLTHAIV
ncbi:MAG: tRNA (guanosine(46)-N7)-methyltransferase TrmB [Firmicutes bacterium HGW-Firmicutes-1]|jgi:tRNA (guanine-N7-)-methyltransferase|nr:MAG: tRNA (guanosine(46)-N7)-methyltransferase TrmB [Firmicutes bacterium HGW-Firmicutes-1]